MIILSGPSGVGKTTLRRRVQKKVDPLSFSISWTTRPPRPGEKPDQDYHFVSREAFEKQIQRGGFLEWARVHNDYYGTPSKPVQTWLRQGRDVLLDIDVQGAGQVKRQTAGGGEHLYPSSFPGGTEKETFPPPDRISAGPPPAPAQRRKRAGRLVPLRLRGDQCGPSKRAEGLARHPPGPTFSNSLSMPILIEAANTEWVWGKQAVRELLRTNPQQVKQVWLSLSSQDPVNREIRELCQKGKIPVVYKDRKAWDEIFRVPAHQSVAAQLKFAFRFTALPDLLGRIKAAEDTVPVLLMIDHLQDPHNLGAIIRTASGAGVRGIILPKDRTCPISGTVHKTAAGALEYLPLVQVTNLAQTIEALKKEGFWFLSLEAQGP